LCWAWPRAFAAPSIGTIIPQLLPPAQFANANAWISSCFELASISGPALGGFLIAATGGTTTSYVVAAVGHLIAFVTFFAVPLIRQHEEARNTRSASDLFAGFGFLIHQPVFLAASTLDLFAVLLGGSVALLPVFAKDILHVGPSGLGWLRAAPSLGALLMAVVSTRLLPWKRPGRVLLITVAGFGASALGFGLSKSFAVSMVFLFLTGAFDMVSVVIRSTLEQVVTPDHLRGRVRAVNAVFIGCSNELGAFESGATAAWLGPVVSVAGGGVGTLLVVAIAAIAWPTLAQVGPLHTLTPESGKLPKKSVDPSAGDTTLPPANSDGA
jgi:predicted MFS family arabinose efflux permease